MGINTTESLKKARIEAKCRVCGTEDAEGYVEKPDRSYLCIPCYTKRFERAPEAPAPVHE